MKKFRRAWIIDDSWIDVFAIKRLMNYTSFSEEIVSYKDGYEALNQLTLIAKRNLAECPDVILLDVKMPVWDGWKFLDFYKELGISQQIDLFLVSTSSISEIQEQLSEYDNVTKFYEKPIRAKDLREMMEIGNKHASSN